MRLNLFVYYGAIIPQDEVFRHMAQSGQKDIYAFIMSKGLMYRKIGNQNSFQIVAGKEIFWDYKNNMFAFTIDDEGEVHLESKDGLQTEILKAQEKDIQTKLLNIGTTAQAKYYVFTSYEV